MLPKIKAPMFDVVVPSNKKKVQVRPFDVREEKILLMARQSGEPADFFKSISQVVQNCVVDNDFDALRQPLFDVSFIFTKLRAISISDVAKVSYRDEDGEVYSFDVDLNKITVKFPENVNMTFKVNKDISFTMSYPPTSVYTKSEFFDLSDDKVFDTLVCASMQKIFEGETVHDLIDAKPEEIMDFVNSLPAKFFNELRDFFLDIPTIYNKIEYKNKEGKDVVVEQKSIEDFFMFG